jgi:hypothetical protein
MGDSAVRDGPVRDGPVRDGSVVLPAEACPSYHTEPQSQAAYDLALRAKTSKLREAFSHLLRHLSRDIEVFPSPWKVRFSCFAIIHHDHSHF